MSDIILKNRNGNDVVYKGITEIKVHNTDGGTETFTNRTLEATEITLDFSNGYMMDVYPEEGCAFNRVAVIKPSGLVSENIVKGVTIAGIEGTHECSGEGGGDSGEGDGLIDWVNDGSDTIDNHAYTGLECFRSVKFTKATSISNNSFFGCPNLCIADFHVLDTINGPAFGNSKALDTLIIRTNTMCAIASSAANSLFGIKLGGGIIDYRGPIALGTGYIYVPAALVETYKADAAWSKYADQFRAIEDYPDVCG